MEIQHYLSPSMQRAVCFCVLSLLDLLCILNLSILESLKPGQPSNLVEMEHVLRQPESNILGIHSWFSYSLFHNAITFTEYNSIWFPMPPPPHPYKPNHHCPLTLSNAVIGIFVVTSCFASQSWDQLSPLPPWVTDSLPKTDQGLEALLR